MSTMVVNPFIAFPTVVGDTGEWSELDKAANYATTSTVGTSWNPFAITVPANKWIRVDITTDNASSSLLPDFTLDKPAGESNSWQEVVKYAINSTGGTVNRASQFYIRTSVDWSAHTLNIALSTSMTVATATWQTLNGPPKLIPRAMNASLPINLTGNNTPMNGVLIPFQTSMQRPRLGDYVGGLSCHDSSVPALDTDTDGGAWLDAGNAAGGSTGGTASDVHMRSQYKVSSGHQDVTFNPVSCNGAIPVALAKANSLHVVQMSHGLGALGQPRFSLITGTVPLLANDLILAVAATKPYNATITTPTGYDLGGNSASGTTAVGGNDTGSVQSSTYKRISDASDATDVDLVVVGLNVGMGVTCRIRANVAGTPTYDVLQLNAADTDESGTTGSMTFSGTPDITVGDIVFFTITSRASPTGVTSPSLSIPGCTGTTYLTATEAATSVGSDISVQYGYMEIDSGACTGSPVLSCTGLTGSSAFAGTLQRARVVV